MEQIVETIRQAVEKLIANFEALDGKLNAHIEENAKRFEACDERLNNLDEVVFDQIIGATKRIIQDAETEEDFKRFAETYGEKFNPYIDTLKKIEGEDFDFARKAYSGLQDMRKEFEGQEIDEGAYVDSLIESITLQIKELKKNLGVAPEEEVTVSSEGEVIKKDVNDMTGEEYEQYLAGLVGKEEKKGE